MDRLRSASGGKPDLRPFSVKTRMQGERNPGTLCAEAGQRARTAVDGAGRADRSGYGSKSKTHSKSVSTIDQPSPGDRGASGRAPVMQTIAQRVSCRSYKADAVPEADLLQILEAARLAPSACNEQPWRFAVARSSEVRRRIVEEGFLPGAKMRWALEAPVHVVLGMKRSVVTHRFAPALSGVDYPWVDVGIAGEHLVLAATELGLGTCWIGWIKSRVIGTIVGWPRDVRPVAVIAVGYPRDLRVIHSAASRRKPMEEPVRWL